MKKLLALSLALASIGLYACGGDGGPSAAATNPNDSVAEFSHPTGTLTSSNANDVAKESLKAQKSSGVSAIGALKKSSESDFLNFSGRTLDASGFQACVSTSGNTSTVDWACAAPVFQSGCTGAGETKSTYDQSNNFTEVVYDGFALNCTDFAYSCDGTINYSTTNAGYSCGDLTCEINTINLVWSGCTDPNGHHLIRISGDSFVVQEVVADGGCGTLTVTVTDSTGSHTMTCDIATHASTCSSASDVNTISNCTIN